MNVTIQVSVARNAGGPYHVELKHRLVLGWVTAGLGTPGAAGILVFFFFSTAVKFSNINNLTRIFNSVTKVDRDNSV